MKHAILIVTLVCFTGLIACGQQQQQKSTNKPIKTMDTSKITNEKVKAAFEAWQNGDSKTFLSLFTPDARLYDEGSPRNFQGFVKEACGHEKFTSIDKVENDGKDIFGNFHTEKWGDFKTYFKFHFDAAGRVDRLDIGQAN